MVNLEMDGWEISFVLGLLDVRECGVFGKVKKEEIK